MFNSPLQYCPLCKEYVELDQTIEECAAKHGCRGHSCPLAPQFNPPAPAEEAKPPPATSDKSTR